MRAGAVVAVVAAVVLGGCGAVGDIVDGATGRVTSVEALRDDLLDEGVPAADVDCVVDDLEERTGGLEEALAAADGDPETFGEQNPAQFGRALAACLDEADFEAVTGDSGEVRDAFVEGLATDPSIDDEQAACIYDGLIDRGFDEADILALEADVSAALAELGAACGVEQMTAETIEQMDPAEVREAFVGAFALGMDISTADAECVYDTMLERGVPAADFAGVEITPEAETALLEVLGECGVGG